METVEMRTLGMRHKEATRVVVLMLLWCGWAVAAAGDAITRWGLYRRMLTESVPSVFPAMTHDVLHRFIYALWPVVALVALALMAVAQVRAPRGPARPASWIPWFMALGLVTAPAVGWTFRDRSADSTADEMMHHMAIQLAVITWGVVMAVTTVQAWRRAGMRVQEDMARLKAEAALTPALQHVPPAAS